MDCTRAFIVLKKIILLKHKVNFQVSLLDYNIHVHFDAKDILHKNNKFKIKYIILYKN
jgi:hypothetical protein